MSRHLFTLTLLIMLTSCSTPAPEEPAAAQARPVQVVDVRKATIPRVILADGILRAVDQSAVTAKINAPVKQLLVNRGDHVRVGQLLAVLESADLAAAVAEAKGSYDQAQASYRTISAASLPEELGKAESEAEAAKQSLDASQKLRESREELLRQGALARRLVDEANVAYAQAKSQYDVAVRHLNSLNSVAQRESINNAAGQRDAAKGRYEATLAQQSYSEIRSPISGVIADRPVFPGEMATSGAPLLTVMDVSRVIARVSIPQAQAAAVSVGQSAKITAADGSGQAAGKVTVVSPAMDPQSTTVEVWVEAPNMGEHLRPGGTVHVAIDAGVIRDAIVVPPSAVSYSPDGGSAVIEIDKDLAAHSHQVQVGIRGSDLVEILEGAEPGMRIVAEGGLGLEDGVKVRIEQPGADDKESDEKGKAKGSEKE